MSTAEQNELLDHVGCGLRNWRRTAGLSQEEAAWRASIDNSYLGRIEQAKVNPSLLILIRVCRVYGHPIADLLS